MGLLITNGQFVAFNGEDPTALVVNEQCGGQVRLVNCNFWGSFRRLAVLKGKSFVGFSDCYFSGWDARGEGLPAIDLQAGRLQVQGSSFVGKLAMRLGEKAQHAIVTGNNGSRGVRIEDLTGGKAILRDNELPPPPPQASKRYTLHVGADEDEACLTGDWHGAEPASDGPPGTTTARWSGAKCGLKLPVLPDTDYDLSVWLMVAKPDPTNSVSVAGGDAAKLDKPGLQQVRLQVPRALTAGKQAVEVAFSVKAWVPSKETPGSNDTRQLGVRVFAAEMVAR